MNLANRWVFLAGLFINILLVIWTVVSFYQEWTGAFWPIFIVWTAATGLFVLAAFLGRADAPAPSSRKSGGPHHE